MTSNHRQDNPAPTLSPLMMPLSRRQLLQRAAVAGTAIGAAGLLAPWGSAAADALSRGLAPERIKRGGRLRVAHIGGGASETLDPNAGVTVIDAARATNLFDRLARLRPDGSYELELAETFEPNADATEWTVRLRSGVTWHDGKPLTADDVIYTLRRIGAPKSTLAGVSTVAVIDLPRIKKLDKLTLRLPLVHPIAELPNSFTIFYMQIVQNGATSFKHPIGTGPFMFKSFTPGQSSLFVRNPHYWQHGKPYVDGLEQLSIPDPGARLNALIGGEVDCMENLDFAQAKAQMNAGQIVVLIAPGSNIIPILMAVDLDPFKDVRVRQAMRLIADRPALLEAAQLGFGGIGNDLFGKGLPEYDSALPQRVQDVEKAKFLLKKAGRSDLKITLYSAKAAPGMLESATAFAAQAQAAGVTISVNNGPADTYFSDKYLKVNFGQSQWASEPISTWVEQSLITGAPYNETHWHRATFEDLFIRARGELDPVKRKALMFELQKQLWDEGGYLIWGFYPLIDGLARNVRGAVPNPAQPLSNLNFRDFWLA